MEKKESKFKDFIKEVFSNKKKRPIATLVVILPFLIIIGICGFLILKQAKSLINVAVDDAPVENTKNKIVDGVSEKGYVLRDNATTIQKEYFAALKDAYENPETTVTEEDKAGIVVKCFVADFYTWSNKQGQYDVGGMYYVYEPDRKTIYIQARDEFYKYLSNYINDYGVENLLEVESVETTVTHSDEPYPVVDSVTWEESEFNTFNVVATWNYVQKEGSSFNSNSYDTKAYFTVIDRNGRFEIVYAGNEEYHNEQES